MGESSARKQARLRAELILKVRAGLMTATEAAGHLGVSRKTYYTRRKRRYLRLSSARQVGID